MNFKLLSQGIAAAASFACLIQNVSSYKKFAEQIKTQVPQSVSSNIKAGAEYIPEVVDTATSELAKKNAFDSIILCLVALIGITVSCIVDFYYSQEESNKMDKPVEPIGEDAGQAS